MESRARWAARAVYPLLTIVPLGMLATSVVLDMVGLASRAAVWGAVARLDLAAGILAGVLVGALDLADLCDVPPGTRAARLAVAHASTHVGALCLFTASFALRTVSGTPLPSPGAVVLSALGLAAAGLASWLDATRTTTSRFTEPRA